MPEIKHNFTGGKMNKDLDERIVPNGEYRDAMNIQVSTSEDSDVGTVQNILGNKLGCEDSVFEYGEGNNVTFNLASAVPNNATTVGSVSDEKNDTLYWLISGGQIPEQDLSSYFSNINPSSLPISFKDMIVRKTPQVCQPVLVDKYGVVVSNLSGASGEASQFIEHTLTNTLQLGDPAWMDDITVGMTVVGYKADGTPTPNSAIVNSIGSLNTITTPWTPNYADVPTNLRTPVLVTINNGGWVSSTPGDAAPGATNVTGFASNTLYIPTHLFNSAMQVGDKIEVSTLGNGVGITPSSSTVHLTSLITSSTPVQVVTISNVITVQDNNGLGYDFIKITISETLEVNNTTLDGNISNSWYPGLGFLNHDVSGNGLLKVDITFETIPVNQTITNTITLPSNSPWLNEIYDVFYPNGTFDNTAMLQIESTGSSGVWPDIENVGSGYGGCVDPNSVDAPDFSTVPPTYDNEFDIIECNVGTSPVAPGGPNFGFNKSLAPGQRLTFKVPGGNIADNIISLDSNLNLEQGYDYLHFFSKRVLNFNPNNLITGINIIDDMLLWVDGVYGTEPKKINVSRSIKGTWPDGDRHTIIVNDILGYGPGNLGFPIKEEHITVIKKSPKLPPTIKLVSGRDDNKNYTAIVNISNEFDNTRSITNPDPNNDIIGSSLGGTLHNFSTLKAGDRVMLKIATTIDGVIHPFELSWYPDDILVLKEFDENGEPPPTPISAYTLKGRITHWIDNTIGPNAGDGIVTEGWGWVDYALVELEILSVAGFPPGPIDGELTRKYAIDKFDEEEKLFEFKFPRFSYRYKYEDGEYSTFAPFSQVAFLPGPFDYHPKKGYNIGMTNRAKSVIIQDFVNWDTPKDVVEIDLLYKEDASPNIYIVDTIKPDDDITTAQTQNAWYLNGTGKYEITSDTIYAVVPSNQVLRPWDNVPLKAQSQEIVGNRITYGNYLQNFDLKAGGSVKNYFPDFKKSISSFSDVKSGAVKSIKSLREYQIGVVFIDEYGRQTPVISNPTGTLKLEKERGQDANRLKVGFNTYLGNYPNEMKYFKFFIKETSGEYYNMAMDRFYEAEDSNVWLAFPSTDRNKVDIDTFLILKKGVESDEIVKSEARYKILAIENEAPDYIKTKRTLVFSAQHVDDSTLQANDTRNLFLDNSFIPLIGESEFKVNWVSFANTSAREIHKVTEGTTDQLYMELTSSIKNKVTRRYRISSISTDTADDDPNSNPTSFNISIDGTFKSDVNPFTNDPSGLTSSKFLTGTRLKIYRYHVENGPQFDGRFFVKIYKDGIFTENISNVEVGDVDYRVISSKKIYYMEPRNVSNQRHKYIFGQSQPGNGKISTIFPDANKKWKGFRTDIDTSASSLFSVGGLTFGTSGAVTLAQKINNDEFITWNRMCDAINKMGQDGGLNDTLPEQGNTPSFNGINGAGWQPFTAFFRGINLLGNSAQAKMGIKYRKDEIGIDGTDTGDLSFEDVWFIDAGMGTGTFQYGWDGSAGWDNSPNSKGGRISESGGTGVFPNEKGFTISFGGIQPHDNKWHDDDETHQSHEHFDIGGNNKNYSPQQQRFVEAMEPGVKFRFKEDPSGEIYTVSSNVNHGFSIRYEDLWEGPTEPSGHGGSGYRGKLMIEAQMNAMKGFHPQKQGNPWSQQSLFTSLIGASTPVAATALYNNIVASVKAQGITTYLEPAEKSILYGLQSSTWFRPENFTRGFRFHIDKQLAWNPVAPTLGPIDGGKEVRLSSANTTAITDSNPFLTVADAAGNPGGSTLTDQTDPAAALYEGAAVNKLEVGMVLDSIDGGSNSLAADKLLIVSKIDSDNDKIYFKKYDPSSGISVGTAATPTTTTAHLRFRQYSMNGLSPNSAKNINYFNNGEGFSASNMGTNAVGYTIEFVEPIIDEALLPSNPAVWETEPKKSTDLNIYYEASGYNPLILDNTTMQSVLPVGSRVESVGTDAINPGTSIVSNRDPNYPNAIILNKPAWTLEGTQANSPASGAPLQGGSKLNITRPDGSIIRVRIAANGSDVRYGDAYYGGKIFIIDKNLYLTSDFWLNWHNCYSFGNGVESNRIRDNFNLPYIGNGVIASTTLAEQYNREHRKYGLIYSGIYNSTSGVNNLNQFIAAEKITKDINPIYGSIQKLHMRDSDLVTLCEDKILRIIANKDAVFNADGNPQLIATPNVLGQTVPFTGEYGISKNPESFASESYRAYFTDKVRGTVMRLSRDGLTSISDAGMKDWFRDNLKLGNKLIGSYDDRQGEYNITIVAPDKTNNIGVIENSSTTVSFREQVKGWVSFKSFVKENGVSCANSYYTFKNGILWQHHAEDDQQGNNPRNTFYGSYTQSSLVVVLNDLPSVVKSFKTLNYEGTQTKIDQNLQDNDYYNLANKKGWYVSNIKTDQQEGSLNEFIEKEGKWFNHIKGKAISTSTDGHLTNSFDSFDQGDSSVQGLGTYSSSLISGVIGCTDPSALNYNPSATVSSSCITKIEGCTDQTASNYNSSANSDNGSCTHAGCTDTTALNYNSNATVDDGSCIARIYGCTDTSQFTESYTPSESSTKMAFIAQYSTYINANPLANTNETSATDSSNPCTSTILGCMDVTDACACTNNCNTNYHHNYIGAGGCCGANTGCNDSLACNYDSTVAVNASTSGCVFCTDTFSNVTNNDGSSGECGTGELENKSNCLYCGGQHRVEPFSFIVPESVGTDSALLVLPHILENDVTQQGTIPTHQAAVNTSFKILVWTLDPASGNPIVVQNYGTYISHSNVTYPTFISPSVNTLSSGTTWSDDMVSYGNTYNFDPSQYVINSNPTTHLITGLNEDTTYTVEFYPQCTNSTGGSTHSQKLPLGASDPNQVRSILGTTLKNGIYTATFTTEISTIYGCTDGDGSGNGMGGWAACNYNPLANSDDGTCEYASCAGCLDTNYLEYNQTVGNATIVPGTYSNATYSDPAACKNQIVTGCMDQLALNYSSGANRPCNAANDGVGTGVGQCCTYAVYGCLGSADAGAGGQTSNEVLTTWDGKISALNYGCEDPGTGSRPTSHCNMTTGAPSRVTFTPPNDLAQWYAPMSGGTAATPTNVVTHQSQMHDGNETGCLFTDPTKTQERVDASGGHTGEKDVQITVNLGDAPWNGQLMNGSNIKLAYAVQFLDNGGQVVGDTNLGTVNAGSSILGTDPSVKNAMQTVTTGAGAGALYPSWSGGTASITVVNHTQLQSAAVAGATKVLTWVGYSNSSLGTFTTLTAGSSVATSSTSNSTLTSGCMDPTASNLCTSCDVHDQSQCIPHVLGCTDNTYVNYNSNATAGNPNATSSCANCVSPSTGILAIVGGRAYQGTGQNLTYQKQIPDIYLQINANELLWGGHQIVNGINYSAYNTSHGVSHINYGMGNGSMFGDSYAFTTGQQFPGNWYDVINYPNNPSTDNGGTNSNAFGAFFELEYRIKLGNAHTASNYNSSGTPGSWGAWRNLYEDFDSPYMQAQGETNMKGGINYGIPIHGGAYTMPSGATLLRHTGTANNYASNTVSGFWPSTQGSQMHANIPGHTGQGQYITIVPTGGGIATNFNGVTPTSSYKWGPDGFNPDDEWEFRLRSYCHDGDVNNPPTASPWYGDNSELSFKQPSCLDIYGKMDHTNSYNYPYGLATGACPGWVNAGTGSRYWTT